MAAERLYAQLDETSNELADIREREKRLIREISNLIGAFTSAHRCTEQSFNRAVEYTADALTDLFDDAEGPAFRLKSRLSDAISQIEEADLRRSAPVVL